MRCPSCSKALPDSAKFCDKCGAKLQSRDILLCPVCRLENNSENSYCIHCGSALGEKGHKRAARPISQTRKRFSPRRESRKRSPRSRYGGLQPSYSFIYILLALVVLMGAAIASGWYFVGKEERSMNRTTRNVFQEMKAFLNDIDYFRFHNLNFYWEDGYGQYSSYRNDEYKFIYLSNDTDCDGNHRATKFAFIAVPLASTTSATAYFTDESYVIYRAKVSPLQAAKLRGLTTQHLDWTIPSNTIRPSRCDLHGVVFSVFNRDVYAYE